jgi:repressor LexA
MRRELTDRQRDIFDFIARTSRDRGYPPTIREIMEEFGIASTNGVRTTLAALEKKGYIRRHPMLSRGIELTGTSHGVAPVTDLVRKVPLLGRVAAGAPILAVEHAEQTLAVDPSFAPPGEVFALRVSGDSMKGIGILDGDVVLARHQETASRGDVVVAVVDGEATVKRYFPEAGRVRLKAENAEFDDILVDPAQDFRIAGRLVSLMRRF